MTDDEKWAEDMDKLMDEGAKLIKEASDEALEYVKDAVENINDKQWRKMAVETQVVEIGIGVALAEHLVPVIYNDMMKSMHKKLKTNKVMATSLRQIYIGRVVKNVRRKLNERNQ